MWSAISKEVIKLACFNFVDDQTLLTSGPDNYTTGEQIYARAQEMMTYWEESIRATGGAVAHDKSYWYLVDFALSGKKWRYRTIDEMPGDLLLPKGEGRVPTPVERLEVTQSKELLGLEGNPASDEKDEAAALRAKTEGWRDKVRMHKLNKKMDGMFSPDPL